MSGGPGRATDAAEQAAEGAGGAAATDAAGRAARQAAEVIVVGGGPAGSTAAFLLAAAGRDVVLLDRARFPRGKACGECLSPGAVAALRRLGLADAVAGLDPAPLLGWELVALAGVGRGGHAAPVPPDAGVGWGVDRALLDAALLDRAREAGARVREGARVVGAAPADAAGCARVWLADGDVLAARVVIGADGLRSVVARAIGAPARVPRLRKASLSVHLSGVDRSPDRGRLVLDPHRTIGLAPLDPVGRRWTLSVVVPSPRSAELPREGAGLVAAARDRLPGLEHARAIGGPLGSGPFDWPVPDPVSDGVLLIGDAAGYYDPLTGQGIYRALRSAELAAETVDHALTLGRTSGSALGSYRQRLASAFHGGRRVQRLVQAALERPRLLARVLARLHERGLLSHLVAVTGDARSAATLLRPDLLLRLAGALPAAPSPTWR